MAPAKRKHSDVSKKKSPAAQKTPTAVPRVTRSMAAAGGATPNPNVAAAAALPAPPETTPGKKTRASAKTPTAATPAAVVAKTPGSAGKRKTPEKAGKSPAAKKMTPAAVSLSQKSSGSADATPSGKGRKGKATRSKAVVAEEAESDDDGQTVIIIEACKQCQSFKRTAEKVKKGLEEGLDGVVVHINREQPRKGCFEVRDEKGEVFVSLLGMPRPFKKMKDLDLDEVVADIVRKKK